MLNQKTLISLFLVLTISTCSFSNDFYLAVDPTIRDMEYSRTQKYLALVNDSFVNIYDSMTFQLLMEINYDKLEYLGLAFSADENYISVAYYSATNGSTSLNTRNIPKRVSNIENSSQQTYPTQTTPLQLSSNRKVTSLCWLGSTFVLFGLADGSIYIYKPTNQTYIFSGSFADNLTVAAVACSQKNSYEFAISGSKQDYDVVFIYELSLGPEKAEIIEKQKIQVESKVNNMVFTKDNNLYVCGQSNIVLQFLAFDNFATNITYVIEDDTQNEITELFKIRATDNDEFLATTSKDTLVVINKEKETKQIFANTLPTFALSPTGASILHLFNSSHIQIKSQCKDGQYFDEGTSMCQKCSSTCGKCLKFSTRCFTCASGYIFTNYVCSSCKSNCEICSSLINCTKCKKSYNLQNGVCYCPLGKYSDNSTNSCRDCPEGCLNCWSSDFCVSCAQNYTQQGSQCVVKNGLGWQIILIIIIGVLIIVGAIGFAIWFKFIRKTQKNALLNTQDQ